MSFLMPSFFLVLYIFADSSTDYCWCPDELLSNTVELVANLIFFVFTHKIKNYQIKIRCYMLKITAWALTLLLYLPL